MVWINKNRWDLFYLLQKGPGPEISGSGPLGPPAALRSLDPGQFSPKSIISRGPPGEKALRAILGDDQEGPGARVRAKRTKRAPGSPGRQKYTRKDPLIRPFYHGKF